jgi:hypothetical protein
MVAFCILQSVCTMLHTNAVRYNHYETDLACHPDIVDNFKRKSVEDAILSLLTNHISSRSLDASRGQGSFA